MEFSKIKHAWLSKSKNNKVIYHNFNGKRQTDLEIEADLGNLYEGLNGEKYSRISLITEEKDDNHHFNYLGPVRYTGN